MAGSVSLLIFGLIGLILIIAVAVFVWSRFRAKTESALDRARTFNDVMAHYVQTIKDNETDELTEREELMLESWVYGVENDLPDYLDYREGGNSLSNLITIAGRTASISIRDNRKDLVAPLKDIFDRVDALVPDPDADFREVPPVGTVATLWGSTIPRFSFMLRLSPLVDAETKEKTILLTRALLKHADMNCGMRTTGPSAVLQSPYRIYATLDTLDEMTEAFFSDEYTNLREALIVDFNTTQTIQNGWKAEHSYLFHDSVAYYGQPLSVYNTISDWLSEFFSNLSTTGPEVNNAFGMLLSSTIRNCPFGFNGRGLSANTRPALPSYVPELFGTYVLPFSGWYKYKEKDFEYCARVQRQGIASFEGDRANVDLGGVWILGKHAYTAKRRRYNATTILRYPGVIQQLPDQLDSFPHPGYTYTTFRIYSTVHSSYIGILNDHENKSIFYSQHFTNENMQLEYREFGIVDHRGASVYFTCKAIKNDDADEDDDASAIRYFNATQPEFTTYVNGRATHDDQIELQLPLASPMSYFIAFNDTARPQDTFDFVNSAVTQASVDNIPYTFEYQNDEDQTCIVTNDWTDEKMLTNWLTSPEPITFAGTAYTRLANHMYIPSPSNYAKIY